MADYILITLKKNNHDNKNWYSENTSFDRSYEIKLTVLPQKYDYS